MNEAKLHNCGDSSMRYDACSCIAVFHRDGILEKGGGSDAAQDENVDLPETD